MITDKLKTIDEFKSSPFGLYKLEEPLFLKLAQLIDRKKINKLFIQHLLAVKKGKENVSFGTFKDAITYEIDNNKVFDLIDSDDVIESLNTFPCCIKLNNLQFSDQDISDFSKSVFREYGVSPVVMIFVTPPGIDSFAYHIDPMKTMILHLYGEKKWFFPIDEGQDFELYPEPFDFNQNQSFSKVEEVIMKPGDMYGIGKGTVHRADNLSNEVNIHMAIPLYQFNHLELLRSILTDITLDNKNFMELGKRESGILTPKEAILKGLHGSDNKVIVDNLAHKDKDIHDQIQNNGRPKKEHYKLRINRSRN